MPPDATGQDANGYYKDVRENGNIVRYRDVMITDSNRKKVYRGWLASDVQNGRMNNGNSMPLNTIIDAQGVPHNVMPWSINESSLVASSIPLFIQNQYVDDPTVIRTSRTIIPQIYDNRRNNLSNLDIHGFVMAMLNGNSTNSAYGFSYKDNSYVWLFYKGYTFNWLSVDEIREFGQYWMTRDELNKNLVYYWSVIAAPDGTLVGFGAVDNPKGLDDRQVFELVLHPMGEVILNEVLLDKIDVWGFSSVPSVFIGSLLNPETSIVSLVRNP